MKYTTKGLRHPIITTINGNRCELVTVGHLAAALGRSSWTVRYWTQLGLLPEAPFDLNPGDTHRRRRLYPRPFVNALAELVDRDYMGPRLDREWWQQFQADVWVAYSETVVPLVGVADDLCIGGACATPVGKQPLRCHDPSTSASPLSPTVQMFGHS
jgi:hypothetical protein